MKINPIESQLTTLIIELDGNYLKFLKCSGPYAERNYCNYDIKEIDDDIFIIINEIKKKIEGIDKFEIIFCMPRSLATCRRLRIPAKKNNEINKIISLQAERFLPYPSGELITAYQILSTDDQGFSDLNLIIVHNEIIEKYLLILKEINQKFPVVYMSSYGLSNFFNYFYPKNDEPIAALDIDCNHGELIIIKEGEMVFSRYFTIENSQHDNISQIVKEIRKTIDVFSKESNFDGPKKILISGVEKHSLKLVKLLNSKTTLDAQAISYNKFIKTSDTDIFLFEKASFCALIGLVNKPLNRTLNLIPDNIKEVLNNKIILRERIRFAFVCLFTFFVLVVSFKKHIENKINYISQIDSRINEISKEVLSIEKMIRRVKATEKKLFKSTKLDFIKDIYNAIPRDIYINILEFENDKQIIIRGISNNLNSIFDFSKNLESSSEFKNFNVKLKYATHKQGKTLENINFEIICMKSK